VRTRLGILALVTLTTACAAHEFVVNGEWLPGSGPTPKSLY
jgi:hypothetical protein